MMSRSNPFALALVAAMLAACAPKSQTQIRVVQAPTPDPLAIVLAPGVAAMPRDADVIVQFMHVLSDSRCPRGVTCVWAGEVKVWLLAGHANTQARDEHKIVVGDAFTIGDYRVTLTKVEPEAIEGQKIRDEDYRVTLKMEKVPQ